MIAVLIVCLFRADEDGSTIVVFGGQVPTPSSSTSGRDNISSANVYVLDVPSGIWRQGPDAPSSRTQMACVLVGDQLVVWGGFGFINFTAPWEVATGQPLVFDLARFQWVNKYTAPAEVTSSANNLGGIIGGTVGALFVLGLAVSAFIYRK
jgi:hypothetical protein